MKKKIILALSALMMFLCMCGFREDEEKVHDRAGLFTEAQAEKLQQLCIEYGKKTKMDILVLTTDYLGNSTCQEYADDFYDYGGYGYEEDLKNPSGIVFLISVDPKDRQIYISTAGLAILYIDDGDVEDILDVGYNDCVAGNYYEAERKMIIKAANIIEYFTRNDKAEELLEVWYEGDFDTPEEFITYYDKYSNKFMNNCMVIFFSLVIALVVAAISIAVMNKKYTNTSSVSGGTYFLKKSFIMHNNFDNFIRTDVVRTKIESSSSGGGSSRSGGSSHSSSSGRSHGGGGRSF